jgi:hypothetical protein
MSRHAGRTGLAVLIALAAGLAPGAAGAQVLRVGSYHGIPGQFSSIQNAVNAAKPGDWVLVGPGDYKTTTSSEPAGQTGFPAAVLISTPRVNLRGMDRNGVVIDGTRPGSPQCSSAAADQNFGPAGDGAPAGLNGVMVWKAADVWVQNLTTCNFLGGSPADNGSSGNGVWWNGGADSGQIGGQGYLGTYLTATSTFYSDESTAAQYGIFSSNWNGGTWDQIYASNFNDSGFYIGACQNQCNQTLNHGWSEYNALGYSGTNSGGSLVVENSQFDNNEDGFDTNSQNADFPPPQDGTCPNGATSPITHTHSCWVFMDNYVHDNNNPNIPSSGSAAAGPVGTGISVSGARNDTIMGNTFANNGAWGTIVVPYPDSGPPCTGGTQTQAACIYDEYGDAVINNTYSNNGFFGNPTNGDIAVVSTQPGPTNCYSGNTDGGGPASTSPAALQTTYPDCNGSTVAPTSNPLFLDEVACDSMSIQFAALAGGSFCPPATNYPRRTQVTMHPLPAGLPTMPGVCSGLTPDPWCSGQVIAAAGCSAGRVSLHLSLAVRERFQSVRVKVGRAKPILHRARGNHTVARFSLGRAGARARAVRVAFRERIGVGPHRETIAFTRVYTVCGGHRATKRRSGTPKRPAY